MDELMKNHREVTLSAFNSAGNMHNPKVVAFGTEFRSIIAKHALPFTSTEGIEKLRIEEARCGGASHTRSSRRSSPCSSLGRPASPAAPKQGR